jgi:hypothetical protein
LSPPPNTQCAPCARRLEEYRKWRKAGEISGDHAHPVQGYTGGQSQADTGQGSSDLPLLLLGVGGTIFFFCLLILLKQSEKSGG